MSKIKIKADDPYVGTWVHPENNDPLEMVGRKGNHDVSWLAAYIKETLVVEPEDTLMDVCCGNGLITKKMAGYCKQVLGVDYSPTLLEQANKISVAANLSYKQGDARALSKTLGDEKFDKITLCAAFQYFDEQMGKDVIAGLKNHIKPGGKILILDIPDKSKKLSHTIRAVKRLLLPTRDARESASNKRFHTFGARIKYLLRNIAMRLKPSGKGANDELGWWWDRKELAATAEKSGFDVKILNQPSQNPHHTYRFDVLLFPKE